MSYNENLNHNEEIWKPVYLEEFKHIYEVSNQGRVRKGNFIRKEVLDKKKYKVVNLYNGKYVKNMRIHRLVKFSFEPVENPENYQIHHRDGQRQNNNLYNLQQLTHKEHLELEMKKGNNRAGMCGKKSLRFMGIIGKFDKQGYLINFYEGLYDLESNVYYGRSVYDVINKRKKSHRGFFWKRFPKKHKPIIGNQYDMNDPMFEKTIKKNKKKPKKIVQLAFKF
jgi:hypothetical protein